MRFNEMVQSYNTQVKTFPTNLIARMAGLKPSEDQYQGEDQSGKRSIRIKIVNVKSHNLVAFFLTFNEIIKRISFPFFVYSLDNKDYK
jgi:hypothetical protein